MRFRDFPYFIKRMARLNRKKGHVPSLPYLICICGILFAAGWNLSFVSAFEKLVGNAVMVSVLNWFVPFAIANVSEMWIVISDAFARILPSVLIGATTTGIPLWAIPSIGRQTERVCGVIMTALERRREIQRLAKTMQNFDKTKVNHDGRDEYLSYDGTLIKLFREPSPEGKIVVSEGITALEYGAFDRFVVSESLQYMPRFRNDVKTLVLPGSIRDLNLRTIPREICLKFKDSRTKMFCNGKERHLNDRDIEVSEALFTGLLKEFNATEIPEKYDVGFYKLYDDEETALNDSFAKISDPLIKIRLMDILYEHMLCGILSPLYFRAMDSELLPEYKEMYTDPNIIVCLYGSEQNAIDRFALKYYESENIRREQSTKEWRKKHPDTVPMTRAVLRQFAETVRQAAEDPESFREKNAEMLKKIASQMG